MNPLKEEAFGEGKHPPAEALNDGKVSPDGRFFCGTCDWASFFGNSDSIKQYYWTMSGNNKMGPLLYGFDIENGITYP